MATSIKFQHPFKVTEGKKFFLIAEKFEDGKKLAVPVVTESRPFKGVTFGLMKPETIMALVDAMKQNKGYAIGFVVDQNGARKGTFGPVKITELHKERFSRKSMLLQVKEVFSTKTAALAGYKSLTSWLQNKDVAPELDLDFDLQLS